ncbi:MAG: hypothetical protein DRP27_10340 [Thermotogae bacterium]|nr:MAG: hypothetical protein DRP27_10340 [Thermotogota bacterium]
MISTDPWVWLSAFLTICSFTLLYGDNPLFRIAEYVYVSVMVAHSVVTGITTLSSRFTPLFTGAQPHLIVTLILGIMSLFVVWRKYAWIASFPISIMLGVGTGLTMRTMMRTDLVGNMSAVISETAKIFIGPPASRLGYFIRVVFTLSGLVYLLFTIFIKGPVSKPIGYIRTFGKYVFITYLGLQVGNDIIMFQGLVTSALVRLFKTWLGI